MNYLRFPPVQLASRQLPVDGSSTRRSFLQNLSLAALAASLGHALSVPEARAQVPEAPSGTDPHEQLAALPGMKLTGNEQIAMLMYDRFTALDLVGPHFFFSALLGAQVHLVTPDAEGVPVKTDSGMSIMPSTTIGNVPSDLDVLFVPGGASGTLKAMTRDDIVQFVASRGKRARYISSVCTGSLILGQAGLLDGKRATTHWGAMKELPLFGATPVQERVVVDGNLVTGAGVSAGLDFAIQMVALLRGRPYAEGLMLQAEYDPHPPFPGGSVAKTPPAVAEPMKVMVAAMLPNLPAIAAHRRKPTP